MSADQHLGTQFLYHVSHSANRASIAQHGLLSDKSEEGGSVWFFSDEARARSGMGKQSDVWRANRADVPHLEHGSDWSAEWHPDDPVWATSSNVRKVERLP